MPGIPGNMLQGLLHICLESFVLQWRPISPVQGGGGDKCRARHSTQQRPTSQSRTLLFLCACPCPCPCPCHLCRKDHESRDCPSSHYPCGATEVGSGVLCELGFVLSMDRQDPAPTPHSTASSQTSSPPKFFCLDSALAWWRRFGSTQESTQEEFECTGPP